MSVEETTLVAERTLLGGMLLSPAAMWKCLDIVTPIDFLDPKHEVIAEAIQRIAHQGVPADTVSVTDDLLKHGLTQQVPVDYVFRLTSVPVAASSATYHADIVQRHAALRRASHAATVLGQGVAEGRDVIALVDEARTILEAAVDERAKVAPIGSAFDDMARELEHDPKYIPTRWPHLNGYIDGLMPGAVYVIAARPGGGKTIAGLNLAVDLAKHGTVAVVSLEMPKQQLLRRLTAAEGQIQLTTLSRHTLSKDDWLKVAAARTKILDLPLYIDDRSGVTMTQIESYVRQVARARKEPMSGLIVDYLQLIPSPDSRKSRWEHVGELTRAFKLLAKDLSIPVVLLSQLNRESERNRRLPTLADLRESGSIEQDADVVVMLQRRVDKNDEPEDVLDVVVAKNRHGRQGRIELAWAGKFARLEPMRWGDPTLDFKAMQAGGD